MDVLLRKISSNLNIVKSCNQIEIDTRRRFLYPDVKSNESFTDQNINGKYG